MWGANFAVRRSAVERVGDFDESIDWAHGDEEEWLQRLRGEGGKVVYLPGGGRGAPARAGRQHPARPQPRGLGARVAVPGAATAAATPRPGWPTRCACWAAACGTPVGGAASTAW